MCATPGEPDAERAGVNIDAAETGTCGVRRWSERSCVSRRRAAARTLKGITIDDGRFDLLLRVRRRPLVEIEIDRQAAAVPPACGDRVNKLVPLRSSPTGRRSRSERSAMPAVDGRKLLLPVKDDLGRLVDSLWRVDVTPGYDRRTWSAEETAREETREVRRSGRHWGQKGLSSLYQPRRGSGRSRRGSGGLFVRQRWRDREWGVGQIRVPEPQSAARIGPPAIDAACG